MRRFRWAAAAAAPLWLGACALFEERAVAPPVPIPAAAGPSRSAERDHADLLAAFGGERRVPALQAILDEAARRLHEAGGRPGEPPAVTILDSPKVNAFALPSGRLYVTRGLLALAGDPAEVAAVLAHETAHVARGHAAARTEREARSALLSRVSVDLLNDPRGGAAARVEGRASLAGFSRAQELEADAAGIAYAAAAGYDPHAAARFLRTLERHGAFERRGGAGGPAEAAASHPASAERVAAATLVARRLAPERGEPTGRGALLAALDGLPYGDRPDDGLVRGGAFIHPRLRIAFTAPDGVALENTARAVLGASADGRTRLLLDAVAAPDGEALGETLAAGWKDRLDAGSARTAIVGGRPVAFAASRGDGWTFRLAALRIGPTTFRIVLAGRGAAAEVERALDAVLGSLREVGPEEAAELRPQRIALVEAAPGDAPDALARRMGTVDRPLERFLLLNGLERGAALRPGERYKIVVD